MERRDKSLRDKRTKKIVVTGVGLSHIYVTERKPTIIIIIIIKQSFITRLLISTYHENERSE